MKSINGKLFVGPSISASTSHMYYDSKCRSAYQETESLIISLSYKLGIGGFSGKWIFAGTIDEQIMGMFLIIVYLNRAKIKNHEEETLNVVST